jgi:hypothetical protein
MSDNVDRRLHDLHTAMGGHLDALLDLDTGLSQVLTAASHRPLGRNLDRLLDLDAGLHAIVPRAEPADPPAATASPLRDDQPVGAVAALLMSWDTPIRLAVRVHPALDYLALTFALVHARFVLIVIHQLALDRDRARDLARAHALAPDFTRALDRAHDLARARARVLDHGLDLDCALAFAIARDLTLDLTRDLDRAHAHADDLALDRNFDRARGLALALDRAPAPAPALGYALAPDLTRALAREFARDLDRAIAIARDLNRSLTRGLDRDLDRDLDRARHDFTVADLRQVDLAQVRLDGLRWSDRTRWPSDAWKERALRDSVEIEPGVYEFRGGTAQVPTDVLAP